MAGGVALNSVANGRILRETPFTELYVQPAAGDSGRRVGAALFAHHQSSGSRASFVMEHAYWGADIDARSAIRATAPIERACALSNAATRPSCSIATVDHLQAGQGHRLVPGSASNGVRARSATGAFSPTRAAPT